MTHILEAGELALVIPGNGANHVRFGPSIDAQKKKGKLPEHAVLAILPKPASWEKPYPHDDGAHMWYWVRGRTDEQEPDGRFRFVEGWTAANENRTTFLERMFTSHACRDTMGTAFDTYLSSGQQAYVLPADGLNVRKESDPHGKRIGVLRAGTVVTVTGNPECDTKMVWWRVKPLNAHGPKGWVSEGGYDEDLAYQEWYLVPLTLE